MEHINESRIRNMRRGSPKSLVVLGNGKSLAGCKFHKYNVDTIGISQAFRYWRRLKWYPTYYVCLDRNINLNFARDIKYLVKNRTRNGIKKFFLTREILKKYPKIAKVPQVYFIEDLNKSGVLGFTGESGVTSGAFAVRFGIFLGYKDIYLLGIDANYRSVNQKWLDGVCNSEQRLTKTINPEPDYFFVGYRAKGDYLHIPPKRRWKERSNHLAVFRKIANEFNSGKVAMVYNSNIKSKLHISKILPFKPIPTEFIVD